MSFLFAQFIVPWKHGEKKVIYQDKNLKLRKHVLQCGDYAFYRNVFSAVPRAKVKDVALMLKAIHAQENKEAARKKAADVAEKLRNMRLKEAAKKIGDSVEETLTYMDFPSEHWQKIRTNNVIERLNREIRRRTRVVGTFPDGNSALMLVCARLRHVSGNQWGGKKYMSMKHLETQEDLAD